MILTDLLPLSSTAIHHTSREVCNLSISCACMPPWHAPKTKRKPIIWSFVSTASTHLSLMRKLKSTVWLLVASNKEECLCSPLIATMRLIFSLKVLTLRKISISPRARWKCTLTVSDKTYTSSGLIYSKLAIRGLKMLKSLLYNHHWRLMKVY